MEPAIAPAKAPKNSRKRRAKTEDEEEREQAENNYLKVPFEPLYFRPGIGIVSHTKAGRLPVSLPTVCASCFQSTLSKDLAMAHLSEQAHARSWRAFRQNEVDFTELLQSTIGRREGHEEICYVVCVPCFVRLCPYPIRAASTEELLREGGCPINRISYDWYNHQIGRGNRVIAYLHTTYDDFDRKVATGYRVPSELAGASQKLSWLHFTEFRKCTNAQGLVVEVPDK